MASPELRLDSPVIPARLRPAGHRTASWQSSRPVLCSLLGVPGSLVGGVGKSRTRPQEPPMTIDSPSAASSADASTAGPGVASAAPPSRPWRLAALLLAGAAQLITISALVSVDPIPVTWASLLLAISPAPLAAAALYAPAPADRPGPAPGGAGLAGGVAGRTPAPGPVFLPPPRGLAPP